MRVTFWGTRGSIAAPGHDTVIFGGNTTCVEIVLGSGRTIIIDAGTGMRGLGDALLARNKSVDVHLLLTHIHWDHLWGFPFFGPLFRHQSHIVVDGCEKSIDGLKRLLSSSYVDGTWPVSFDDLKARIESSRELPGGSLHIDGTLVESHPLQHPQGGLGFKFTEHNKTFVFLTDNELLEQGWHGTSFNDFVRFARNADVLVHDCQYLPEEIEIRRGWGHSDMNSVARLASDAGVRKLILFHHDPWRKDEAIDEMVSKTREIIHSADSYIGVEAAKEGSTLTV